MSATKTKCCPFCEGGGLAEDGERGCDACGGSGSYCDALVTVAKEVALFMHQRDNPYRDTAARHDLDALLLVQRLRSER